MNIKDYLHLYLGVYGTFKGYNNPLQLTGISDEFFVLRFSNGNTQMRIMHLLDFKPILRPLSNMSEEEAQHFAWLCMDSPNHLEEDSRISKDEVDIELAKYDGGNLLDGDVEVFIGISCRCYEGGIAIRKDGSICLENDNGENEPIDEIADKIKFLLFKHFDLFGLIEAGLAIDATIKNQTA